MFPQFQAQLHAHRPLIISKTIFCSLLACLSWSSTDIHFHSCPVSGSALFSVLKISTEYVLQRLHFILSKKCHCCISLLESLEKRQHRLALEFLRWKSNHTIALSCFCFCVSFQRLKFLPTHSIEFNKWRFQTVRFHATIWY